jgi:hypothetical protein
MRTRALALIALAALALAAVTPARDLRAMLARFYTGVMPVDQAIDVLLDRESFYG